MSKFNLNDFIKRNSAQTGAPAGYLRFDLGDMLITRSCYSDEITPKHEIVYSIKDSTDIPQKGCKMQRFVENAYTPDGKLQQKLIYEDGKKSVLEFYDKQEKLMDRTYLVEGEKVGHSLYAETSMETYSKCNGLISLSELEIIGLLLKHIQRIIPEKTKAREEILSTLQQKAKEAKEQERLVPPHAVVWSRENDHNWEKRQQKEQAKIYRLLGFNGRGKKPLTDAQKRVLFYLSKGHVAQR